MSNRPRKRPSSDRAAAVKAAVPGAAGAYTFVLDGKAYALPPAYTCAPKIPAGALIDAVMDGGDLAELKLGLTMLKASGVSAETMDALRGMPMDEFSEHLSTWMTSTGTPPGESVSSSS